MSIASRIVKGAGTEGASSAGARLHERLFFGGMALAMAITVFAGFAPSYYLKSRFGAPPDLTPLLHVHGLAMSAWMLLLVTQAMLISSNRVALHRRIGVAGAIYAPVLVVVAAVTAVLRTKLHLATAADPLPNLRFLSIPMATAVVFPALIGSAIYWRGRSDVHKRLVLLATIEFVTAAVGRLPVIENYGPVVFFGATDLFILAIVIYDLATRGRVHVATAAGGLVLVLSQVLRIMIAGTVGWLSVARWLTS